MRLSEDQIRSFDEQGFLFLPSVFSEAEVALLRGELPALLAREGPEVVRERDDASAVRLVYGSHAFSEPFARLSRHPRLDDGTLARRINDTQAYYETIPADIERWLAKRLLEPTQRLAARHPDPAEDWIRRMRASLDCSGDAGEGHRRVP